MVDKRKPKPAKNKRKKATSTTTAGAKSRSRLTSRRARKPTAAYEKRAPDKDGGGGPEGKKYKYRRFRHLLMSIHQLSVREQHRRMEENIREWMGEREQIDDQMVIGIRPASFSFS